LISASQVRAFALAALAGSAYPAARANADAPAATTAALPDLRK